MVNGDIAAEVFSRVRIASVDRAIYVSSAYIFLDIVVVTRDGMVAFVNSEHARISHTGQSQVL